LIQKDKERRTYNTPSAHQTLSLTPHTTPPYNSQSVSRDTRLEEIRVTITDPICLPIALAGEAVVTTAPPCPISQVKVAFRNHVRRNYFLIVSRVVVVVE
jgi:hypothetical protein